MMAGLPVKLSSRATQEFWEIPVLFEDAWLLALDKPAGLATSPDRLNPDRPSLTHLLHEAIARGAAWTAGRSLDYLANAHRLEAETSGALLLARDRSTLIALANQFSAGQPVQKALALVQGTPPAETWETDAKLAPHPTRPGVVRVDPRRGKKSKTQFAVIERFAGYTLVRCVPLIGRPQQVQVHLRHCGLPVVGDALYGGRPLLLSRLKPGYRFKAEVLERPLMGRVALHVEQLDLVHPGTGAALTITTPLPKDFQVSLKYLRRYAPGLPAASAGEPPAMPGV